MFVACLGVEGNQLLEALSQVGYTPKRHFYLYPSGLLAAYPPAERAMSLTSSRIVAPFTTRPKTRNSAKAFDERQRQRIAYPYVDPGGTNMQAGRFSWRR